MVLSIQVVMSIVLLFLHDTTKTPSLHHTEANARKHLNAIVYLIFAKRFFSKTEIAYQSDKKLDIQINVSHICTFGRRKL